MQFASLPPFENRPQHAVVVRGDSFEVIHRRRAYGWFTYEWATDLSGIELMCDQRKFGEICTPEHFHADLSDFDLPNNVRCVATIALGCLVRELGTGSPDADRIIRLRQELDRQGFTNFSLIDIEK